MRPLEHELHLALRPTKEKDKPKVPYKLCAGIQIFSAGSSKQEIKSLKPLRDIIITKIPMSHMGVVDILFVDQEIVTMNADIVDAGISREVAIKEDISQKIHGKSGRQKENKMGRGHLFFKEKDTISRMEVSPSESAPSQKVRAMFVCMYSIHNIYINI